MKYKAVAVLAVFCFFGAASTEAIAGNVEPATARVEVVRVPEGGIQPQAVVGADGSVHLLYYSGDADAGDLYYVQRTRMDAQWSKPRRVNSEVGSAVAKGNDRGGHIAIGRNGIVHVAWNGSERAKVRGPEKSAAMFYTRLVPGSTGFEAQRNVMTASKHLDGGGSVASDSNGDVYVVWHASPVGSKDGAESERRVFVAASADDGATFGAEIARSDGQNGACGCCGLKAAAMDDGELLVLYRSARNGVHRDMHLLRGAGEGTVITDLSIDAWEINACPMTTASICPAGSGAALAWETRQDIHWTRVSKEKAKPGTVRGVGDKGGNRKYPSIAVEPNGRVLVAWTEEMRWGTGGKIRWSLFGEDGTPIENSSGGADGVPVWSLVSAIAMPGGGFMVLY